jgi:ankyrin repeat protein
VQTRCVHCKDLFWSIDNWVLFAVIKGHLETMRVLLTWSDDATHSIHAQDYIALHYAAVNGHLEIVRLLLEPTINADAPRSIQGQCAATTLRFGDQQ